MRDSAHCWRRPPTSCLPPANRERSFSSRRRRASRTGDGVDAATRRPTTHLKGLLEPGCSWSLVPQTPCVEAMDDYELKRLQLVTQTPVTLQAGDPSGGFHVRDAECDSGRCAAVRAAVATGVDASFGPRARTAPPPRHARGAVCVVRRPAAGGGPGRAGRHGTRKHTPRSGGASRALFGRSNRPLSRPRRRRRRARSSARPPPAGSAHRPRRRVGVLSAHFAALRDVPSSVPTGKELTQASAFRIGQSDQPRAPAVLRAAEQPAGACCPPARAFPLRRRRIPPHRTAAPTVRICESVSVVSDGSSPARAVSAHGAHTDPRTDRKPLRCSSSQLKSASLRWHAWQSFRYQMTRVFCRTGCHRVPVDDTRRRWPRPGGIAVVVVVVPLVLVRRREPGHGEPVFADRRTVPSPERTGTLCAGANPSGVRHPGRGQTGRVRGTTPTDGDAPRTPMIPPRSVAHSLSYQNARIGSTPSAWCCCVWTPWAVAPRRTPWSTSRRTQSCDRVSWRTPWRRRSPANRRSGPNDRPAPAPWRRRRSVGDDPSGVHGR